MFEYKQNLERIKTDFRNNEGIVVFPSLHLMLLKRHYMSNRTHDIGHNFLKNTFEQYIEAYNHERLNGDSGNMDDDLDEFRFDEYENSMDKQSNNLLVHLLDLQHQIQTCDSNSLPFAKEIPVIKNTDIDKKSTLNISGLQLFDSADFLSSILLGKRSHESKESVFGWEDHYSSTAVVGNPNSYKRKLLLAKAFHWAKKGEHVLFILFDKNEEDLRKHMVYPAFLRKLNDSINAGNEPIGTSDYADPKGEKQQTLNQDLAKNKYLKHLKIVSAGCRRCNDFIHFLRIRSGCISADEFFSTFLDHIKIYCDEDPGKKSNDVGCM